MAARPKPAASPPVKPNPGETFRSEIHKAKLGGVDPSALLLRLTRSDMSRLKRDRNLGVGDISFLDGEMHFLDVLVSEGEVAVSSLVILQP
jgi:hypothetical protein